MPFEIVRADITALPVDAVVNAANPLPAVGSGVDAGIYRKGGPRLLAAREKIGAIAVGQAAVTRAYGLSAKYVIHAVGPVWQGGDRGEETLLRRCYDSALALAAEKGCQRVAFPLLSAGNYGFPKDKALQIAVSAFSAFLMEHEMHIILAVFDRDAFTLSEKLFQSVRSYIDENYIEAKLREEYDLSGLPKPGGDLSARLQEERRLRTADLEESRSIAPLLEENIRPTKITGPAEVSRPAGISGSKEVFNSPAAPAPHRRAAPPPVFTVRSLSAAPRTNLEDMLRATDAGFSETLLKLIDRAGKKDAEVYKKANIDRKLFSKIRSNPSYKPSKPTAVAFAIALELDLEETKDFIGRAGYALTHSSKFDIIVEYFIQQRNYDVFQINETLFAFDQPLIGG